LAQSPQLFDHPLLGIVRLAPLVSAILHQVKQALDPSLQLRVPAQSSGPRFFFSKTQRLHGGPLFLWQVTALS